MGRPKTGQKKPQTFRISDEMRERLTECADRTKLDVSQIASLAVEAAIEAIEANDYMIVMPIKFDVQHVSVALRPPEQGKASA